MTVTNYAAFKSDTYLALQLDNMYTAGYFRYSTRSAATSILHVST